jgi:hypothetical protein
MNKRTELRNKEQELSAAEAAYQTALINLV